MLRTVESSRSCQQTLYKLQYSQYSIITVMVNINTTLKNSKKKMHLFSSKPAFVLFFVIDSDYVYFAQLG